MKTFCVGLFFLLTHCLRHHIAWLVPLIFYSVLESRPAQAQAPVLNRLHPAGGQRGTSVDVTLTGSNLAGATGIWTDLPIQASLPKDSKEAGAVVVRVEIPPEASVGIGGVRVATPRGISNLRLFAIDDLQQVAEREPNSRLTEAQKVELPCVIDGAMEAESWDYYRFSVQAGQKLTMEVVARRLGSKLDSQIRLLDAAGHELLYADDSGGLGQDTRLRRTFQEAGDYVLEVRDVKFSGGDDHFYRLRLGDFPPVTVPFPLGGKRDSKLQVVPTGPDTHEVPPLRVSVPNDPRQVLPLEVRSPTGGKVAPMQFHLSSLEETIEQEPNDDPARATRFVLPRMLNGYLAEPGDIDRFVFAAKKGDRILLETISRELGSPVDLFMTVEDGQGKELASNDDAGRSDAKIDFRVPADGKYTVSVWDLNKRGDSDFVYRIRAVRFRPGFRLLVRGVDKNKTSLDLFNVPQGTAAAFFVRPVRIEYKGPIALSAEGLPDGVTLSPTMIRAGRGDTLVTLNAAGCAALGAARVRIVGTATVEGKKVVEHGDAGESLAAGLNLVWPPANLRQTLALAVTERPSVALEVQLDSSALGRGTTLPITVTAKRAADFHEPLTLGVLGLPANVTLGNKSIPKDKDQTRLTLSAKNKAPLGVHSIAITATAKRGEDEFTVVTPALNVELRMPVALSLGMEAGKVAAGGKLKVKARAERILDFKGAIQVELKNLPKGITAPKAAIREEAGEVEIELVAAPDAPVGAVQNLSLVGTVNIDGVNQSVKAPDATLEVIATK